MDSERSKTSSGVKVSTGEALAQRQKLRRDAKKIRESIRKKEKRVKRVELARLNAGSLAAVAFAIDEVGGVLSARRPRFARGP